MVFVVQIWRKKLKRMDWFQCFVLDKLFVHSPSEELLLNGYEVYISNGVAGDDLVFV